MKFNKIFISKNITNKKGIDEISLHCLGNVVGLVGRNGSGKSRVLDLIENNLIKNLDIADLFTGIVSNLPPRLEFIREHLLPYKDWYIIQRDIQELQNRAKKEADSTKQREILEQQQILLQKLSNSNRAPIELVRLEAEFQEVIEDIGSSIVKRIKYEEISRLQSVITDRADSNHATFENLVENIEFDLSSNEFTSINKSALTYLSRLPHQLSSDEVDSFMNKTAFEDKKSYKKFLSLKKYIQLFLKKELVWKSKSHNSTLKDDGNHVRYTGIWHLDSREFVYSDLSDGEKTLFAYALLFFLIDQNPTLDIQSSIILIDEPELHLHPDTEIEILERFSEIVGDRGQLIFATHSINILSHMSYDEIFMVKNNAVYSKNSQTPYSALSELMQIENRILKLSEFIDSVESWTYINFMIQNFLNPDVIESSIPGDPQILALKNALLDNVKEHNMLLDFGAGKGRLIEHLIDHEQFSNSIQFHALEPQPEFHLRLDELGVRAIYRDYVDLPKNQFDFIVMSNVLHEIPLVEWVDTLNTCIKSLTAHGFLIIIEAKRLNKGEKIGNTGFLLLGLDEMEILFGSENIPSSIKNNEDKITCCILQKDKIQTVTDQSLKESLTVLAKNSLKKLENLRKIDYNKDQLTTVGRESAFLSQQYINATIALKSLGIKQLKI